MRAIGLDLGTTSICGILMDARTGAVLRSRTEASHAFIAGKHPWESLQSPERIIALAMDILEDLWCADVCAIGVTGQMHGIVYTDRTGKAVSPLYVAGRARPSALSGQHLRRAPAQPQRLRPCDASVQQLKRAGACAGGWLLYHS